MIDIRFYNTLSRSIEAFQPIDPPEVYMYNCGPTVYDFQHIGNFRTFIFADVLRRFLELVGFTVRQVMNITDLGHMTDDQTADGGGEDKMEVAARRVKEAKKRGELPPDAVDDPDDPYQVADYYTKAFIDDARVLGLKITDEYPQHMPRATRYVPQMQAMIAALIEKKFAYVALDQAVYFDVQKFSDYGRLSGNTLEKLRGGASGRVLEEHQSAKKHPADFLLWKPDPAHIMKWDSPWGTGYPNWHIECSTMAVHVLRRDIIDIHTGGEDNIFPHHECEIAQTRGATGHDSFARYWMHARHLLFEGQKMSKSKGTFFTRRDLMSGQATGRDVHPAIIRYELMRGHYRSNLNFTFKGLQDSALAVAEIRRFARFMDQSASGQEAEADLSHPVLKRFSEALADDLNISGALAVLFEWMAKPKGKPAINLAVLRKIDSVLNVLETPALGEADELARGSLEPAELNDRLHRINEARKSKNYELADQEKQLLRDLDYEVMDTPEGTVVAPKPIVVAPAVS